MLKQKPQGLYFTAGTVPTDAERAEARSLGIVSFRNAVLADESNPESAPLVAGKVPAIYRTIKGQKIAASK